MTARPLPHLHNAFMSWDHPNPFSLRVSPQAADIDGLNHTNNAVYVQWCEKVAWAHSESLGLSLGDYHRLDRAMAIRRGEYDYLLPSFAEEALTLGTWLFMGPPGRREASTSPRGGEAARERPVAASGDGKLTMERRFQLVRDSDGATLMRGRWQLVCIELGSGKPRRMPAEFTAAYLPAAVDVVTPGGGCG
jgi:acyl-CoA thioester hydrolase